MTEDNLDNFRSHQPADYAVGPGRNPTEIVAARVQMKNQIIVLTICLGLILLPVPCLSSDSPADRTVIVFKPDGSLHCGLLEGVNPEEMALELSGAGIEVLLSRKGFDGREGVAQCGEPTGQINIFEIPFSDLTSALEMGFMRQPENMAR